MKIIINFKKFYLFFILFEEKIDNFGAKDGCNLDIQKKV